MNRIGFSYQYDTYAKWINASHTEMVRTQQQMSTGKRLNTLSDDPFATSASISARSVRSGVEQYLSNLKGAKNSLNLSEASLGDVKDLLNQANVLAVKGGNSSNDATAMASMANQVKALQQRLVDIANTRGANGEYIFAGQQNTSPAYSASGGVLNFTGDTNATNAEAGPNWSIRTNSAQASSIFVNAYAQLEQLRLNLSSSNYGAVSSQSVGAIQQSQDLVNQERGVLGSQSAYAQSLISQYERRSDELTSTISGYEDIDIAQAATRYQAAQTAYQAALTTVGKLQQLSLMDYIR